MKPIIEMNGEELNEFMLANNAAMIFMQGEGGLVQIIVCNYDRLLRLTLDDRVRQETPRQVKSAENGT